MRAVRFDEYGDYDVLKVVDVAEPEAGPDEVLVRLAASAVNPFDNTCRRGWVAAVQPGMIQGNEGAGVVVKGTEALPATRGLRRRLGDGPAAPGGWAGQAGRRSDVPARGCRRGDSLPHRGPAVRQGRPHHLTPPLIQALGPNWVRYSGNGRTRK